MLTPENYLLTKIRTCDLENLLRPFPYNSSLGTQLKELRETMGISFDEICRMTLLHPVNLHILERGPGLSNLENYFQYADCLGLTLTQVMHYPKHEELEDDFKDFFNKQKEDLLARSLDFEKALFAEVSIRAQQLIEEKQKLNPSNLRSLMTLPYPKLAVFPSIKDLFNQSEQEVRAVHINQRDLAMLEEIKRTVQALRAKGYAPFWIEVHKELRLSQDSLQGLARCQEFKLEVKKYSRECFVVIDKLTGKKNYVHISVIMTQTQELIDKAISKQQDFPGSEIAKQIGYHKGLIARHKPLGDLIRAYRAKVARLKSLDNLSSDSN